MAAASAARDYLDPGRFSERTLVTDSLPQLASQTIRRLSGIAVETSAVFNMATQFVGGKTYALSALYHLAPRRPEARSLRGVDAPCCGVLAKKTAAALFVAAAAG